MSRFEDVTKLLRGREASEAQSNCSEIARMGGPHRLQLLKPNYTPIDCTAEVVGGALELLRVSGKPLFRFDFEKIHGFKCISDENLELEVHMGNGKMGKVKLRCSGPHQGPSPVQALNSDLEAVMPGHSIPVSPGPSEGRGMEFSAPDTPRTLSPPPSTATTPSRAMSPNFGAMQNPHLKDSQMPKTTSVGTWGPGRQGSSPVTPSSAVRRSGTWRDHMDQSPRAQANESSQSNIKQAVERFNSGLAEYGQSDPAELKSDAAREDQQARRSGNWDTELNKYGSHQHHPEADLVLSGPYTKKETISEGQMAETEVQVIMCSQHDRPVGVRSSFPGKPSYLGQEPSGDDGICQEGLHQAPQYGGASTCRPSLEQLLHHQREAAAYQEELEAARVELRDLKAASDEQLSTLEMAREQVARLQADKREMAAKEEEYKETVYKGNQATSAERQEKERAAKLARELQEELAGMEKQLQQVRLQVKEAEDCAREADSACVAANEARAALRADLESANKQIERLREAKREALERIDALDSRGSTNAEQVSLLKTELQRMDQAADRATKAAKEEAARSQSLQAEVERLSLLLDQASNRSTEEQDNTSFLRERLAEETGKAEKYRAELEKQESEVEEARYLFASLREKQSEAEAARSAALDDANSAHDEAMSAYREAGAAKAELRALREQQAAWRVNDEEAAEGLQAKLAGALREARHQQAACRAAQEALEKTKAEAEQAGRRASRLQVHTESLSEKAESLAQQLAEAHENAASDRGNATASQEEIATLRRRLAMAETEAQSALQEAQRAEAYAKSSEGASERAQELLSRLAQTKEALEGERERSRRAAEEVKRLKAAFGQAQQSLDWAHSSSKKSAKEVESAVAEGEASKTEAARLRKRLEAAEGDRARLEAELGEAKHFYRLLKDSGLTIRPSDSGGGGAKAIKGAKEGNGRPKQPRSSADRAGGSADHGVVSGTRHVSYDGAYDSLPFYPHPPIVSKDLIMNKAERRGRDLVQQHPGNRRPAKSPSPSPRTGGTQRATRTSTPKGLRRSPSGYSHSSISTDQPVR